jgi:PBS lyase HEAT-like repeat-containing protein
MRKKTFRFLNTMLAGFFLVFILFSDAFAIIDQETGEPIEGLEGIIVDKKTGKPVEGAVIVRSFKIRSFTVSVGPVFEETTSDANGYFYIYPEKLFSIEMPEPSRVEERPPVFYKPGYQFLEMEDQQYTIKMTRIPTIPELRKKEYEAARRHHFHGPDNTVIFRDMLRQEQDFIDLSLYLIDAQPLIDSLSKKSASVVRESAVNKLGDSLDPRAREYLSGIAKVKGSKLRMAALKALAKRGGQTAVEPWISVLHSTFTNTLPNQAAKALVTIGSPAVIPLCESLKSKYANGRVAAEWALGEIKDPRAVEPLLNSLQDHW